MEMYEVTSRILSLEEKTILFGSKLSRDITAVKALDVDNYLGMFKAMYDGIRINIPGLEDRKGFDRVYIYCDLPVGSRHFNDTTVRYNGTELRTHIYDTPMEVIKNEVNGFLIPIIKEALSAFELNTENTASNFYLALNSNYVSTIETLLAGCFLNMYDNTCVSISTYSSILDILQHSDPRSLLNRKVTDFLADDVQYVWYYTHFLVPPEIGRSLVEYMPDNDLTIGISDWFVSQSNLMIKGLSSLFSWNTNSGRAHSIVFSPGYVKYNGYAKINDKHYMALGWFGDSPLTELRGTTMSSSLTTAFENYFNNSTSNKPIDSVRNIFGFNDCTCNVRYGSNRGGFVFVNRTTICTSPIRMFGNVPEFVALDKEFIASIQQIVSDGDGDGKILDFDKFRKREFSIKRETLLDPKEVENSRYITINSSDNKLFVLTKTSKAKETARKMAITRKITVAMQPVIDMAIRIFTASDLELGIVEPELKFPLNSHKFYDVKASHLNKDPKHALYLDQAISKTNYMTTNAKTAKTAVSLLYSTTNIEGSPFLQWSPAGCVTRNFAQYRNRTDAEQQDFVLGYAYGYFLHSLSSDALLNNLYSPSSGMLNLLGVGYNSYLCSSQATFPSDLVTMSQVASYYGRASLTGIQLHYLYTNNFIGENQELSDAIESRKKDTWISTPTNQVTATTAFTFSQEALDTFSTLKKCRSFKDYSTWFNNVKPILESRLTNVICVNDIFAKKISFLILAHFKDLLERLTLEESPFLPKEEEKPSKKKKDTTTEAVSDDTDVKETKETAAAILAVLKGEVNGTDAGTTGK